MDLKPQKIRVVLAGAAVMISEATSDGMEYACPYTPEGETLSCKQKCVNKLGSFPKTDGRRIASRGIQDCFSV